MIGANSMSKGRVGSTAVMRTYLGATEIWRDTISLQSLPDASLTYNTAMASIDAGAVLLSGPYSLDPDYDDLITGLSLDTSTGVISGTPTDRRGRGWHYIRVLDGNGNIAEVKMCCEPDITPANFTHVYNGTAISADTTLENLTGDVLILNPVITAELTLRNITGGIVVVYNPDADNPSGNGIVLSGTSGNVENCTIYGGNFDVAGNGVFVQKGTVAHTGLRIANCRMPKTGTAGFADNLHGIYAQTYVQIEGLNLGPDTDFPSAAGMTNGSGVTMRSGGIVRACRIRSCTNDGITYYADHPGSGSTLLVEKNDIDDENLSADPSRYAINFMGVVATATAANFVDAITYRDNDVNGGTIFVSPDLTANSVTVTGS